VTGAAPAPKTLRLALLLAFAGTLVCLALLVQETPYTLVAFMFLGQPLLATAFLLFGWEVVRELRHRGLF